MPGTKVAVRAIVETILLALTCRATEAARLIPLRAGPLTMCRVESIADYLQLGTKGYKIGASAMDEKPFEVWGDPHVGSANIGSVSTRHLLRSKGRFSCR
jgi:hypothetical protein